MINPNSTVGVTNAMDAAFDPLRDLTGPSITSITNPYGPPGIESQEHADIVAIQVLDIVKEKETLADAFVIACFSDPGINSTREFTRKPVFGIAESGILSALSLGNKFGIIAILDSNSNPDNIDYPIPGNDDARRAIDLYCNLIKETINSAKNSAPAVETKKVKVKDVKAEDKTKTIQELDREKLEKKFSKEDKEKLN